MTASSSRGLSPWPQRRSRGRSRSRHFMRSLFFVHCRSNSVRASTSGSARTCPFGMATACVARGRSSTRMTRTECGRTRAAFDARNATGVTSSRQMSRRCTSCCRRCIVKMRSRNGWLLPTRRRSRRYPSSPSNTSRKCCARRMIPTLDDDSRTCSKARQRCHCDGHPQSVRGRFANALAATRNHV